MQPALHQINQQSISCSEAAARWTHVTAPDVAVGGQVRATAAGNMPELTQHLWLGKVDAQAAATTLAPKLRKSQTEVSNLLSEAVSLEVPPPPPHVHRRCLHCLSHAACHMEVGPFSCTSHDELRFAMPPVQVFWFWCSTIFATVKHVAMSAPGHVLCRHPAGCGHIRGCSAVFACLQYDSCIIASGIGSFRVLGYCCLGARCAYTAMSKLSPWPR